MRVIAAALMLSGLILMKLSTITQVGDHSGSRKGQVSPNAEQFKSSRGPLIAIATSRV
jgi:hypothetical protein